MRSGRYLWRCFGIVGVIVFILAGLPSRSLSADTLYQTSDRRYFEETGYWIGGDFRDYFESNGELEIFGYPISSPYVNDDGILVQYFQNARMGWHPQNPDPYKLQLGLLGDELGFRQPPSAPPTALSPRKVYFSETGHTVSYMFLDYFREHGGVAIFGYPITEMFIENQRIVQYFQRLKLVWDVQTSEITVGNLGEVYVAANRDRSLLEALQSRDLRVGERKIQKLRIVIDMAYSVVSFKRNQDVKVVVLDDGQGDPISNAQVTLVLADDRGVPWPDSAQILSTDASGRVTRSFSLTDITPGTWVVVRADATYGELKASQEQFFLVWW